jgi:Flp pilus assembly protein CpaB
MVSLCHGFNAVALEVKNICVTILGRILPRSYVDTLSQEDLLEQYEQRRTKVIAGILARVQCSACQAKSTLLWPYEVHFPPIAEEQK